MKISNLVLGMALADRAVNDQRQQELMQLADYVMTHPTSRVFYERVLWELGINPEDVPSEMWGENVPDEATGAAALKAAIASLNAQWHGGKLNRLVVVRNLAWQATLLARRLEKDCNDSAESMVQRNGGSTAGLLRSFINPTTRADLLARPSSSAEQP